MGNALGEMVTPWTAPELPKFAVKKISGDCQKRVALTPGSVTLLLGQRISMGANSKNGGAGI